MKKASKTIFTCQACGYQSPKWMGKCPDCGGWGSLRRGAAGRRGAARGQAQRRRRARRRRCRSTRSRSRTNSACSPPSTSSTGCSAAGSWPARSILIGGDPGIGKSTLMLQALHGLAGQGRQVLYVSGEESIRQIRLRSKRLGDRVRRTCWSSPRWRWTRSWQMIDSVAPGGRGDRLDPDHVQPASSARRPAASARCARRPCG
ncbi:MAG: AAA family ATPase [Desulfobacterales bacterium]|nr:AAA family ATPase [Desulfobacterales bacterium]